MAVSNTRTILGITIMVATFFFFLNSLQGVIESANVLGIIILFVGTFGGYYFGRVIVLKQPVVPDFIKNQIGKLKVRI